MECVLPRWLCLMGEFAFRRERWCCIYLASAAADNVQTRTARKGIGVAALFDRVLH